MHTTMLSINAHVSKDCDGLLQRLFTPKLQCNFAKWEPGHGNFYFRYPWGLYQKLGALSRQCASSMQALASYIITLTKSQVGNCSLLMIRPVRR